MNQLTQFETLLTINALELYIAQKENIIKNCKIGNLDYSHYESEILELKTIINKLENTF